MKINYRSLKKLSLLVIVSFVFLFAVIYPVDLDNLGGAHSWISGTTLKFVNEWLEEGAWDVHFTCYEAFDSIEFRNLDERVPYLSYPPGSTFAVYATAKILGRNHVGIYFLKHFQLLLYLTEALLLAVFLYVLLTDLGIFGERGRMIVTYFMTLFWLILPVNVWYLANIYFADQAVILYVMAFLLLEYICKRRLSFRQQRVVDTLKAVVIYFGVLTDYYFWILVFIAFVLRFARDIICKAEVKDMIRRSLQYILPSTLAVGTFIWQLSYTNNWKNILLGRFFVRTGDIADENVFLIIFKNFSETLTDGSALRGKVLIVLEIFIVLFLLGYLKKTNEWRKFIIKNEYAIFVMGFSAPVFQIFFLKNHSAVHEFSMIKIGWILTMSILAFTLILGKLTVRSRIYVGRKKVDNYVWSYVFAFALFLCVTGVPFSAGNFIAHRYEEVSYPLENILFKMAQYEDVYFSFTLELPNVPPQQLAISEKQVYRISALEDIDLLFPGLPKEAERMLIVEKNIEGKDTTIAELENRLIAENKIEYEDDLYCVLRLE